ncbi:MAG TPA: dihydrodipicolinate synthase family protein [Firmicutes bacterium]|nr:dihydrodipicolinate synthase family protein [Candidatus Fermentithermobacillaceae bacterium]
MAKIGVLAAPVTPFKAGDLSVDEKALTRLAADLLSSDSVDGVVPNAHAGEGATLSLEERVRCLEIFKSQNKKGKKIISCVDSQDLRVMIKQAQDAEKAGCDAVMVCPPPIYAWSPEESPEFAIDYHRRLSKEISIPLILFVYPEGNPYSYPPSTIAAILREVPNFMAVKLTYKSLVAYQNAYKTIKAINPDIAVLPTSPAMLFPLACLKMADGILAGGGNFVAPQLHKILTLCEAGKYDEARTIHESLLPLAAALLAKPYVYLHARYKYVTYLTGAIPNDLVRRPQLELSEADKEKLKAVAKQVGLI